MIDVETSARAQSSDQVKVTHLPSIVARLLALHLELRRFAVDSSAPAHEYSFDRSAFT